MEDYRPQWFDMPDCVLTEQELRERLEYEKVQLELLRMDYVNSKLRVSQMIDKLHEK